MEKNYKLSSQRPDAVEAQGHWSGSSVNRPALEALKGGRRPALPCDRLVEQTAMPLHSDHLLVNCYQLVGFNTKQLQELILTTYAIPALPHQSLSIH